MILFISLLKRIRFSCNKKKIMVRDNLILIYISIVGVEILNFLEFILHKNLNTIDDYEISMTYIGS